LLVLGVAVPAVDRPPFSRLKGYRGLNAAIGTDGFKHLPGLVIVAPALSAPGRPTLRATAGFILQPVGLIELLLTGGKDELLSAVTAY